MLEIFQQIFNKDFQYFLESYLHLNNLKMEILINLLLIYQIIHNNFKFLPFLKK